MRQASQSPGQSPRKTNRHNRYIVISSEDESENEESISEGEWYINGILDESEDQYYIDWLGDYSPSWEPKECAGELAVQVWEEKKKKKQLASPKNGTLVRKPQPQSHISTTGKSSAGVAGGRGTAKQTASKSVPVPLSVIEDQGPPDSLTSAAQPRAETPVQEAGVQNLGSPLFVPLDASSDAQEANEPQPLSLDTDIDTDDRIEHRDETKLLKEISHYHNVFGYYPRAPIPPEFRLPGEFEEGLGAITQRTDSTPTTSAQSSRNPILASATSHITATPQPRASAVSQVSRRGPRLGTFSSQQSTRSLGAPSSYLAPRPSQSNNPPLTNNSRSALGNIIIPTPPAHTAFSQISFVPETVQSNTSTSLTDNSIILPSILPSSDPVNHKRSHPSRISTLHTALAPGDLSTTAHIVDRASEKGIGNTLHTTPRSLVEPAVMDDSSIKKEVGTSLAKTMEKYKHLEGSTPREKIANMHARLREKSTVDALRTEPSATPSSVGDIEPSAPASIPETVAPLSLRVDKEPLHHIDSADEAAELASHDNETLQTIQPSALTILHAKPAAPGSLCLGPSEFAVPLPMDSRVKDDYERVMKHECQDVWELIEEDSQKVPDSQREKVVSSMQQILERLSNVATHPDINVAQHMGNAVSDLAQEAAWADYSSAKFLLLSYLIKAAGECDIHLVITVRGEKTQSVVERYLIGRGLSYSRPREEMGRGTNMEVSMTKGSLSFGIQIAEHSDGIVETYKPPSAVIAFDSSLNTKNPSVELMRTTYARNGQLLPVIRLMVANSSEHVELCSPGPPTPKHLAVILRHSMELRDIVGDLQDDALNVHEDANEILTCLLSDNFNASWPIPHVEPLRPLSLIEPDEGETSDEPAAEEPKPASTLGQKRPLAQDASELGSKRLRMDESQDTSQMTEASKAATQTLDRDLQALEQNLIHMRSSHANALEKLQKTLIASQARLLEREKILETLQHRYETRTKDLHKTRQERDRLLEAKRTSEQRAEKQRDELTKLKDERTQLRHELEQARESLKTSGGDMAELEKAREEIRRLTKENASLERKSEYEHKQAEYTRDQYQTASNVAAQSGTEIRQLREENEALTRKAAGEAVRLRELNIQNDESRHLSHIAELEGALASREDLLRRKEDELRDIRRNRPSTRSTSTQPRSPKLNAGSRPSSPGPNNNNGSNFLGRGSALRFSSEMSF
ncbi:class II histone deacetylase complex subunits 2 and 3-domain-containing protein [Aspergillus californicus]